MKVEAFDLCRDTGLDENAKQENTHTQK